MNYCGIDLGKKSSHFRIVDGDRKTVTAGKFSNNEEAIQQVFAKRERLKDRHRSKLQGFLDG